MNEFDKQAEILTKLAQLMRDQVNDPYESITCEYQFVERYSTVSSTFSVMCEGAQTYPYTAPGFATENLEICLTLRELMKGHTRGEWTSFTLSLDASGKAKTKFKYS